MTDMPSLAMGLASVDPGGVSNAPSAYQRQQASPEDFGGGSTGRGLQTFAAGLENMAIAGFKAADHFDTIAADDAANQYEAQVQAMLYGGDTPDATGYMALQGRAALDERPVLQEKLKSLQQQISGNLQNDRQRANFSRFSAKYGTSVMSKVGAHADSQSVAWTKEINGATEGLAMRRISANPMSIEDVASGTDDLIRARTKNAELAGAVKGDPVWMEARAGGVRDALVAQVSAISVSDPSLAWKIVNTEGNRQALGTAYDELAKSVQGRAEQQTGAEAGMRAVAAALAAPMQQQGAVGTPTVDQVADAILQQESSNNDDVETSVDGAVGPGQITPDTFKMYAKEGEDIKNAADNRSVSKRIIEDYMGRYNNDARRAFVGYFSGAGNVAETGSDTPWKEDRADGNGKRVSEYVSEAMQKLQNSGVAVPDGAVLSAGTDNQPSPVGETARMNMISALESLKASTDFNPNEIAAARAYVKTYFDTEIMAEELKATQQKQQNEQATDGYIKLINEGQITPATLGQINADPNLSAAAREHLYDAAMAASSSEVSAKKKAYGPGFWDAYKGVTAPPGDPNRIMDLDALVRRAGPDGDLTLAGVDQLSKTMKEMAKPENAAEAEMKRSAMAYAKSQLSFEFQIGDFKQPDPKGMDAFNVNFIPSFYKAFDEGIKAGKTPYQLLSRDSNDFIVDKLVSIYKRTDAQMMADKMAAGLEVGNTSKYVTPNDLVSAFKGGKLSREEAAKIAVENGWARANPAPSPVPVAD